MLLGHSHAFISLFAYHFMPLEHEPFSALPVGTPHKGPVARSFDVSLVVNLKKMIRQIGELLMICGALPSLPCTLLLPLCSVRVIYQLTLLPWTKWPPFWQTTFANAFSWMKMTKFTETCSSIGSGNGLAPNRRQAITWTNDDPIHWRIYAALGRDKLISIYVK